MKMSAVYDRCAALAHDPNAASDEDVVPVLDAFNSWYHAKSLRHEEVVRSITKVMHDCGNIDAVLAGKGLSPSEESLIRARAGIEYDFKRGGRCGVCGMRDGDDCARNC